MLNFFNLDARSSQRLWTPDAPCAKIPKIPVAKQLSAPLRYVIPKHPITTLR